MCNTVTPIISICIPTYNRAGALEHALKQYTKCNGFDDSIEIVISDNASTDRTQEVAEKFTSKFHNIKYYRNKENIRDSNFEAALKRGTGKYLKLQNDTTLYDIDAFVYMKKCINMSNETVPIFFTNDFIYTSYQGQSIIKCDSFDDFVSALSTYVTAISCFGVWKNQLEEIHDFTKYTELMLNQDDWSYQLLEKYGSCILYNRHYYETLPKKSGCYNWFRVHLDNYYKIMEPYKQRGLISEEVAKKDKRNLLFHFIPELKCIYVYPITRWKFEKKGTFPLLWKYYKNEPYFYMLLAIYPFAVVILNPIHYGKSIYKRLKRKVKHEQ